MNSILRTVLFVLLLMNMTLSLNGWEIGRVCFWLAGLIGSYFLFVRYGLLSLVLVCVIVFFKATETFIVQSAFLYDLAMFIFFALVGFQCFGREPDKLRSLLVMYLLASLPILIMQISGLSPILMYLNVDVFHDLDFPEAEVGKFKDMILYPTLFVELPDINYQQIQGRPSGLSPANNLLSVIVSFAAVLNLYVRKRANLNLGDLVVNFVAVLVASKLTFVVLFLIYSLGFFSKLPQIRRASISNTLLFCLLLFIYYLCFPGLFGANFSEGMIATSLGLRIIDIFAKLGIQDALNLFWFASSEYGFDLTGSSCVNENSCTSGFAVIFSPNFLIGLALVIIFFGKNIWKKVVRLKGRSQYIFEFVVSLVSVGLCSFLVIPVVFQSQFFALILGLVLLALNPFPKLSHGKKLS